MRLNRWILSMATVSLAVVGASLAVAQSTNGPLALRSDAVSLEGAAAKGDGGTADERRAQVVFDTALTYSQLDSLENSMTSLRQQQQSASRVQTVAQQRTAAGVDSPVELTKAKLSLARVRLTMEQSLGQVELLKAKLSQLTGLPAATLQTVSDSIPAIPVPVDAREFLPRAVEAS